VRPVLKSLDQHLYVLSTLASPLIIQQLTAIEWSTEPQPFRACCRSARDIRSAVLAAAAACAVTILGSSGSSSHARRRAFLAIAEDNYAARALGLTEQRLRMASYALPVLSARWPASPRER